MHNHGVLVRYGYFFFGVGILLLGLFAGATVSANRMTSPSYAIDTSVAAAFGGQSSSTNYRMVSGLSEAINGSSASSSYKLGQGYVAQLEQSIQLSLSTASIALNTITPGVSKTGSVSAQVLTDAPGYSLSIAQNNNLTSGVNTIPAISSGTIASPSAWTEGATKGLGLTMTAGPSLPAKWGTSGAYNYAAIPSSTTTLYTRSGYTGGVQDTVTMQPRVDIVSTQAAGNYTNTMTVTVTTIP